MSSTSGWVRGVARQRRLLVTLFVAAVCTLGSAAQADDVPLRGKLHEEFSRDGFRSSGAPLVGLFFGDLSGGADPRAIRIPLLKGGKPINVCFTAESIDGRYSGKATVAEPADASGYGYIDPDPPWKYLRELSSLQRVDLAVVAQYGAQCDLDPTAPFLPVSYDGTRTVLTAELNAPGLRRPNADLHLGAATIAGTCSLLPQDQRVQTYNIVCRFALDEKNAKGTATIQFDGLDSTGFERDSYPLLIP